MWKSADHEVAETNISIFLPFFINATGVDSKKKKKRLKFQFIDFNNEL